MFLLFSFNSFDHSSLSIPLLNWHFILKIKYLSLDSFHHILLNTPVWCVGREAIPQSSPKPMNSAENVVSWVVNVEDLSFNILVSFLALPRLKPNFQQNVKFACCMYNPHLHVFFFGKKLPFFVWIVFNICITKKCNVFCQQNVF